ncbi:MAG: hypothetical protein HQ463_07600 [Bacteroidetes bacterium]|nr:hypothetical protein [Bacteroidota bacterium]
MNWRKLDGTEILISIEQELEAAIIRETTAGNKLKVCIGTDSQVKQDKVEYATAIVFVREKKGGFMYFSNFVEKHNVSLKERMLKEVAKSIEIAYALCPIFDTYKVELEVHADINTDPQFKSNDSLKEAMGYILGMGYTFKAKPDAFASSSCANKVVH